MPTCSQKDVLALSGAGVRLVSEQGCGIRETLKYSPSSPVCLGQVSGEHQELPSSQVWGLLPCWGWQQGLGSVLWVTSVYCVCIAVFPFAFSPQWPNPPLLWFPAFFFHLLD